MIGAYYKFINLPDPVRDANKIRSKVRLDCTEFTDRIDYKGLVNFVNGKGQMYLYKTPAHGFVEANSKRMSEWALTNGSFNLSSIYIEDFDFAEYGYGYPNANRLLSNSSPNPLFPYRNDGYLFIVNKDYSQIELLIIRDGRNLIGSYYQKLIDGGFDEMLKQMRGQASPFFNYGL